MLGVIAIHAARYDVAVDLIGKAIAINAKVAPYHSNLGHALRDQGRLEEAAASFRRARDVKPDDPEGHCALGFVLQELGRLDEAALSYLRALDLKPDHAEAYNNLGNTLRRQGRLDQAITCFRRALDLKPGYAQAHSNLGNALTSRGENDEALACYRKAVDLEPDLLEARSNLLMTLYSSARHSEAEIFDQARAFARQVERPAPAPTFRTAADPDRRLRIGYVSADFRTHPVGFFLERVLAAHDRTQVEVVCYSNATFADSLTERLRASADRWELIAGMSDAEAGALIRRDEVDILVDLSGHTEANRLSLFATRPAPVQVTWLGYFGTTGLSTIDYILADRFVAPPGEESRFTETVWRLPECYLCYSPPALDVETGPFPGLANGFVTFGCFNNRAKVGPDTVATWAAVLRGVAGSRLFLKTVSLADEGCRASLRAQFEGHGIDGDRLILEGHSPLAEAMAAYNRVDIALDPFPFGGCTTTAQTLWMGVPLVTQRGDRWAGRMSQSILAALDLEEWVAEDPDHYVEIARRLAASLPELAALRSDLRRRLEGSTFCDGPRFTRFLEAAYRGMWAAKRP
jgi:predicted O-linked N-acetylglucosamine transferase (SPINDLY family)